LKGSSTGDGAVMASVDSCPDEKYSLRDDRIIGFRTIGFDNRFRKIHREFDPIPTRSAASRSTPPMAEKLSGVYDAAKGFGSSPLFNVAASEHIGANLVPIVSARCRYRDRDARVDGAGVLTLEARCHRVAAGVARLFP